MGIAVAGKALDAGDVFFASPTLGGRQAEFLATDFSFGLTQDEPGRVKSPEFVPVTNWHRRKRAPHV